VTTDYDIICVGGGLGGSSLAKAMAEYGYKVLVVEQERKFKDRVRGEWMAPWGVGEARTLGIYELLRDECGFHPRWQDVRVGPAPTGPQDFEETTPQKLRALCMYHPSMQETLLAAAETAGAQVRRGVKVRGVKAGAEPAVMIEAAGETISARLVVGADGRGSLVRKWGGFEVSADNRGLQLAGLLMEDVQGADDRSILTLNPFVQKVALVFPQRDGRARLYFGNRIDDGPRLQGDKDVPRFIEESIKTGAPAETYELAKAAGPLATFPCIYEWVRQPYADGLALLGDAATTSDQTWGQGLSLTLGAVRRLRDCLLGNDDWTQIGDRYGESIASMWDPIRTAEFWFTEIFMGNRAEANATRQRALPLIAQDGSRIPDAFIAGPEGRPVDEAARRRFFGEE
jgi:2-polyprenyl-6-methoxyphenol hydroxylase-like FAD-dependent oxidoreductase